MDSKQIFKKYYSRVSLEGIIKALICGFIVGFSAIFITAFVTYLLYVDGLWLSIGIGLALAAATTPLFYFWRFRPTSQKLAERIDRLGLDERLITMMELEKDESYIALRQREDAQQKLSEVKRETIKLKIFKAPIIAVSIIAAFAIAMTTLSTLSANGMINLPLPGEPGLLGTTYEVNYEAGEGGTIMGNAEQIVEYGKDAEVVVAVADDVYAFDKWDDGYAEPERTDLNIRDNLTVKALFYLLTELDPQPGAGETPPEPSEGGEPSDPRLTEPTPGDVDAPPAEDPGAGGYDSESNKVIDDINYHHFYEEYYNEAMQILADGGEVPPGMRDAIERYFDILL